MVAVKSENNTVLMTAEMMIFMVFWGSKTNSNAMQPFIRAVVIEIWLEMNRA